VRRAEVRFLSTKHVLAMHEEAIVVGSGDPGIRDLGLVDSAVGAAINAYENTLVELAAIYAYGIAKNHGFVDGNKRTAVYAMLAFLEVNGFELTLESKMWEAIFDDVAAGNITREQLAEEIAAEVGRRRGSPGPPQWIYLEEDEDEDD
jgi:death on curing protein